MNDFVNCDLYHGPRKRGTECGACVALEEVPKLRTQLAEALDTRNAELAANEVLRGQVTETQKAFELIGEVIVELAVYESSYRVKDPGVADDFRFVRRMLADGVTALRSPVTNALDKLKTERGRQEK